MRFEVEDLINGYTHIVKCVREYGEDFSPRGLETKELIGAAIKIQDPFYTLPLGIGRGLNIGIGVAEALQLISGESHPDLMTEKFPQFRNYTDGGTWFHGAYGPRIRNQIPKLISALHSDAHSRQAVLTIWDPAYDGFGDVKDTPCTISLQFFIRNNKLHLVTYMRSNDVWKGLAYDAYQFTMLQIQLAATLGCQVGEYTHNVGSLHLYKTDFEKVDSLTPVGERKSYSGHLTGHLWGHKQATASNILAGRRAKSLYENLIVGALHGQ